jgi:archaemetzincin
LNDTIEHKIIISPMGDHDTDLLDTIGKEVKRLFGFPVERKKLVNNVDFAFDTKREQYYSTPILEKLALKATPDTSRILAITDIDLFIPILTFVYGEAQLGGTSCIISTCRLTKDLSAETSKDIFYSRVIKEAIHELGHTFKLLHCKDPSCIMHYCRSIKDVDQKSDQLCRYCKILLDDEKKRLLKKISGS